LVERFRPQYFRANQQFWLGFVLRWNQHEAEIAQDRETKVLATGDAVLHRAGTVDPGAGISNTSFGITSDTSEHAAGDASNDDDNDEEWIDAFVAEFADAPDGAAQAIQRMKHETFSVRVQLVKMGSALSQLLQDANNDAAHRTSGPDLPCNGLPPTALEKEIDSDEDIEDDDDDDARLFREVYFDTSVAFWNKYVHEFQAGELGVADDGEGGDDGEMAATTRQRPQHSADTGRGNCRVLLRVVNDNVRRRSTGRDSRHGNSSNWGQHSPASPSAESAEDNEVLAATRQRQKELRRLRGVSVVWKHMLAPQAPDADAAEGVI
jgi:hypothetical protein